MIRDTGDETRDTSNSLYRKKLNILRVTASIVIASVLVLPGCSSVKIRAGENAPIAENTADTGVEVKQNEDKSSTDKPNEDENKSSNTKSHEESSPPNADPASDEKPVTDAGLQSSEYIAALSLNLKISTSGTDVLIEFGEAEEKTEDIIWGSDGLEHQTWKYHSKGIELDMVKDSTKQGEQAVKSISISTPCSYITSRNIGIGSTSDEVLTAYEAEIDEENISESEIIAGSIYGGVIFHLEDDRVSSIFIGSAAE